MGITLKVPSELDHSFFFPKDIVEIEDKLPVEFISSDPFIYEIGFYHGLNMIRPWESPEKVIPFLLEEWKKHKKQLESIFSARDASSALGPMKHAIAIFVEMLFWTNGQPVHFPLHNIQQLNIKPVNVQERIEFIISRPKLYHSFAQLSELYIEQQKHFTRELLLKSKLKNVQE
ncbi:YpoC family protein [Mesobacillus maritimus]|uniref:YpoC-like domain-containing protein n=1 Tax=Mesobacillus maritimus TaxID=1643336 RepID=A0ABS7K2X4_9BACI|nr:hypothetical protein [Mesobacillus maritimus]MBY0096581.1 hypothetical protein [Mesobacillus maritimus]